MFFMIMIGILRFITNIVSTMLLGLGLLMFIRINYRVIKKCLNVRIVLGCLMIYTMLVLIIGLAPKQF